MAFLKDVHIWSADILVGGDLEVFLISPLELLDSEGVKEGELVFLPIFALFWRGKQVETKKILNS